MNFSKEYPHCPGCILEAVGDYECGLEEMKFPPTSLYLRWRGLFISHYSSVEYLYWKIMPSLAPGVINPFTLDPIYPDPIPHSKLHLYCVGHRSFSLYEHIEWLSDRVVDVRPPPRD